MAGSAPKDSYCVLALDLATVTGWAIWKPGMDRPHFGALRLPANPQEVGRPMEGLRVLLTDLNKKYGPITDFVFEAQHVDMGSRPGQKKGGINPETLYRLFGLGALVEWVAYRLEARCFKAHLSQWRKHFIGRGAGFKDQDPKQMAIAKCEELGWFTAETDAAEACGVLDYYVAQLAKVDRSIVVPWRDRQFFTTADIFK